MSNRIVDNDNQRLICYYDNNINDYICSKYNIEERNEIVSSFKNHNKIDDFINDEFKNQPKYRIFLAKKIKNKKCNCCCKSVCCSEEKIRKKIFKKLIESGIEVLYENDNENKNESKNENKNKNKKYNLTYNDNSSPELNILYIHLNKNKYYTDTTYSQQKTDLEKEILFLITGLLGGKNISSNSYIPNSSLSISRQSFELNNSSILLNAK